MTSTPPELPDDWWTFTDVLAYLAAQGAPITATTWRSYLARRQAPPPDRRFGRTVVWRPATIRDWHTNRPRVGSNATGPHPD